jgi:dTDP-4-amino-4,6-dideoxygalactose transaminase
MSDGLLDTWPPLPPDAYLRRAPASLPFPLGDPRCTLYALGRGALYHGLRARGLEPGDEVLMPAYHHGSEVEATIRAGLVCSFYEGTERLEPDPDELESLVGPSVRALHLTHYLGFPQDAARWRGWCDERGLLLVEDAAQAWLARGADGRPVGSVGDLAVFCLYKTFGVPDGAALVSGSVQTNANGRSGLGTLVRKHAAWLAGRSGGAATLLLARRRERTYAPGKDFAVADADAGPTGTSVRLIRRLAGRDAAGARRAAYARLLDALADHVPAPFAELPSGASPFAFPVTTDRKAELLSTLARARIQALDLWSAPHPSLPADRFPAAARRRASTVGLPVHQELRASDIERIAAAAAAALSGRPSSPSP